MITNNVLNINKETQKLANTALYFSVYNDKVEDFADIIVKFALIFDWKVIIVTRKYHIYKLIVDGFGGTKKSKEFLNDIILRFKLLNFAEDNTKIFEDIEKLFTSEPSNVKLKELSKLLPSLAFKKDFKENSKPILLPQIAKNPFTGKAIIKLVDVSTCADPYFWGMKARARMLIQKGVNDEGYLYQELIDFACSEYPHKDYSTLKAKAKSIASYELGHKNCRYFKPYERKYTDEELKMTRSENMKRIKALQKNKTQGAIKEILNGLFADEYKHQKGRFKGLVNVPKLARYMGVSEKTILRNLKEIGIR